MALNDPYITATQLNSWLSIDDTDDNVLATSACATATEWVNQYCRRQFNKTTVATARTFYPADGCEVYVHDFWTNTDLVVKTDADDDGTFETTWAASDYLLEPLDGIEAQMTGFPYRCIVAVGNYRYPSSPRRPTVQVTAQWGWNLVPESVVTATKIVAAFEFNQKNSPTGIQSFGDAGIIRVTDVPEAARLLAYYQHPIDSVALG